MANDKVNKGTRAFNETIKAYLEEKAETDALFAVKFANPSKSVDDCVTYILNSVQKSGCCGFTYRHSEHSVYYLSYDTPKDA